MADSHDPHRMLGSGLAPSRQKMGELTFSQSCYGLEAGLPINFCHSGSFPACASAK